MTSRGTPRSARVVLAGLVFACSAAPVCEEPEPSTQVMVVVDAEPSVRPRIHDLDVEVSSGEGPVASWTQRFSRTLTPGSSAIAWPVEIALVPREGGLARSYLVVVTARGESGGVIARLRAISGYVKGRSLRLPLLFDEPCLSREELCAGELTCSAGACVDARVPASELLPFDPDRAGPVPVMPGGEAGGGAAGQAAGAGAGGASAGTGGIGATGCDAGSPVCAPPPIDCPGELCGGCPDGFVRRDQGNAACAPLLVGLGLSHGELGPALNATETRYRVDVPLLTSSLTLTPLVADGVRIELNGEPVAPGDGFALPALPVGETTVVAVLSHDVHGSRTYTFTIARQGAQRGYLKASNTDEDDGFGFSVAADGDTIVVGALREDSRATGVDGDQADDSSEDSGAAYVFVRDGASFTQQAYLKPTTAGAGAHFGLSVAISGDTIAVGAPDRNAGAVYVFVREAETWRPEARLESSDPRLGSRFGASVALRGDTLIVGVPGEDRGAAESGVVYVFTRGAGGWSTGVQLRTPAPQTRGWFGSSVAFDGRTLAVGATGESDGNQLSNGAAYVFEAVPGGFEFEARLIADPRGSADFLGETIAVDGDTVAVGAFGASPAAQGSGAVYVFVRGADGEFAQQAMLSPSHPSQDGHFGTRVALWGDTLIATTFDEDSGARGVNGDLTASPLERSGAAYLFARRGTTWMQVAHLKAELPGAGDRYGSGVARLGDTIVIGAQSEAGSARGVDGDPDDDAAPGSGAVYLVR